MARPVRKQNRWSSFDYSQCQAYFITICLKRSGVSLWEKAPLIDSIQGEESDAFPANHPQWEEPSEPRSTVGAAISRPPLGMTKDPLSAESAHPPLSFYGAKTDDAIRAISDHYPMVEVDKYCLMPDHVHLILFLNAEEPALPSPQEHGRLIAAPTETTGVPRKAKANGDTLQPSKPSVSTIVGQMKRWVSKQCGRAIWQKSFYDRVIRSEKEYQTVWRYIDENPLKWLENAEAQATRKPFSR